MLAPQLSPHGGRGFEKHLLDMAAALQGDVLLLLFPKVGDSRGLAARGDTRTCLLQPGDEVRMHQDMTCRWAAQLARGLQHPWSLAAPQHSIS